MLKSFMEDIGISEDQFTRACSFDTRHMKTDMHTSVFEQVNDSIISFIIIIINYTFWSYNSGLGCRWIWSIQENDDSEKYWITIASSGAITTKVTFILNDFILYEQRFFFNSML